MKREILFRGKMGDGCWVYGHLLGYMSSFYIATVNKDNVTDEVYVNTDTIGQYIGIKDSCGDPIFEGDVLLLDGGVGFVIWDNHSMRWGLESPGSCAVDFPMKDDYERSKIIGNIHDDENIIK